MAKWFHKRLQEARERAGLSQAELADKVGVTGASISNWEHRSSEPRGDQRDKVFAWIERQENGSSEKRRPEPASPPAAAGSDSARNIESAISFQDGDPLGRKGDPDGVNDILFTQPVDRATHTRCGSEHHFVIGRATPLTLVGDVSDGKIGPIPVFDLMRAFNADIPVAPRRAPKIVSPFAAHHERLTRSFRGRRR
jgi:transcriptional regulator with XRE-family HTH domain